MYAIIEELGHQYRVKAGQFVRMPKMPLTEGTQYKCRQILAFEDNKGTFSLGRPFVAKALVKGRVLRHGKSKKILVFKKKRRKGYRLTKGHRQEFTEIYIETLNGPNSQSESKKWGGKTPPASQKATVKVPLRDREGKAPTAEAREDKKTAKPKI